MSADEAQARAGDVIKTSLKLFKAKQKRDGRSFAQRFIFYSKLKETIKVFKQETKQAESQSLPIPTLLNMLLDKHQQDMQTIKESYGESMIINNRL
jgi:hypothetical protein